MSHVIGMRIFMWWLVIQPWVWWFPARLGSVFTTSDFLDFVQYTTSCIFRWNVRCEMGVRDGTYQDLTKKPGRAVRLGSVSFQAIQKSAEHQTRSGTQVEAKTSKLRSKSGTKTRFGIAITKLSSLDFSGAQACICCWEHATLSHINADVHFGSCRLTFHCFSWVLDGCPAFWVLFSATLLMI